MKDLNYNFSIIGLSATWLNTVNSQIFNIDIRLAMFCFSTIIQRAGGVGLYTKTTFNSMYDMI